VEFLNRTPNTNRLGFKARAARLYAEIGRILLLLTAVQMILSPLTQRIWTWDHFLHGGPDFESSVLVILLTLCLALLLAKHCKQSANLFLAACALFSFLCDNYFLARVATSDAITPFCDERVPDRSLFGHLCSSSSDLSSYLFPTDCSYRAVCETNDRPTVSGLLQRGHE
jgi:hypothetical protein